MEISIRGGKMLNDLRELINSANEIYEKRGNVQREVFYHGTTGKFLQSILKNGLQPSSNKVWAEDPNAGYHRASRISYGGIYYSQNLGTATSSALHAMQKLGGDFQLVVAALLQPKSGLPDEDHFEVRIPHAVSRALSQGGQILGDAESVVYRAYIYGMIGFSKAFDPQYTEFRDLLKEEFAEFWPPKHEDKGYEDGLLKRLLLAYLKRKVAYLGKYSLDAGRETLEYALMEMGLGDEAAFDHNRKNPFDRKNPYEKVWDKYKYVLEKPNASEAEKEYREVMDEFIRFLKKQTLEKDQYMRNIRVLQPVTFKGRNRILAVIGVHRDSYYNKPTILKVYRGEVPDDFIKQWKQRVGSNYKIEKV